MYNLSVCIIYRTEDESYLEGCLKSIPSGIEVVLCKTVPTDEPFYINPILENIETKTADNKSVIIESEWRYLKNETENKFHFSEAKNACKSQATRKFLLFLDVDERLVIEKEELEFFDTLPDNIGGLKLSLHSYSVPRGSEEEGKRDARALLRIFRNDTRLNYENRCHEQIMKQITDLGYEIADTSILIKHLGYYGKNGKIIIDKILRNIQMMSSDLAINPTDFYLCERQYATLLLLSENGVIKKDLPEVPNVSELLKPYDRSGIKFSSDNKAVLEMIMATSSILEKNVKNIFALETQLKALHYYKQVGGFA